MDFKDFKPIMYCTVFDIIISVSDIISDDINLKPFDSSNDSITRYAHQVESDIVKATAMVRSHLLGIYTESGLETTPYAGIPFRDVSNETLDAGGDPVLAGAEAGLLSITEWWTMTFTSDTNFSVKGSASGSVGTSNITSDFTSSGDGDLKLFGAVNSDLWTGAFASAQKFYIPIYKHHSVVVSVTSMLALAYALDHLFIGETPNLTEYATELERRAMKWLKDLANVDETGMTIDVLPPVTDLSDIQIPYIELFGITGAGPAINDLADDDYGSYES